PLKGGSLGDWIYNREIIETPTTTKPNYMLSKTPNAAQRIIYLTDKPNEFPSTPQTFEGDPLTTYNDNLKEGVPFFRNHNGEYIVVKHGFSKDKHALYVLTKSAYVWKEQENGEHIPVPVPVAELSDKNLPHSLTEITFEDGLFIHTRAESGFHPTEELYELFADCTGQI
ncbi:MAG TPA: hypothetical protein PK776_06445, partial [Flavobacterium sp.]|nr:hypothetical protein [Flavobacterium sp.]